MPSFKLRTLLINRGNQDSIDVERSRAIMKLQNDIEGAMAPLLRVTCTQEKLHRNTGQTCALLTKAGHYFHELSRLDLWPLTSTMKDNNLAYIQGQLSKLQDHNAIKDSKCLVKRHVPQFDVPFVVKDLAQSAIENLQGLCLSCVKNGKTTVERGNCRAGVGWACKDA